MKNVRVFFVEDKKIKIVIPINPKGLDWDTFWAIESKKLGLDKYESQDYNVSDMPSLKCVAKLRGEKGKGIWIDESIITPKEARKAKEDALDAELAKPNPDPVTVIRLNRELEKMK